MDDLRARYLIEITEAARHLETAAIVALRLFRERPRRETLEAARYLDRLVYRLLSDKLHSDISHG